MKAIDKTLTIEEEKVLDKLTEAWNLFIKLDKQHPSEIGDFADAIHRCQSIIGMRFCRKYRPDRFPIKEDN